MKNKALLFEKYFNAKCESCYKAPARINLIGEHIDYNGGLVLPCAISRYTFSYVRKRKDNVIRLLSLSSKNPEIIEVKQDDLGYKKERGWANYPIGAFYTLINMGYKINSGLDIMIDTNIPLSSGLSSSAALLDLIIYTISQEFNLNISLENIAKISQGVENNYMKLQCGIMDQTIVALGKYHKALYLDCKNFKYEYVNMNLGDYVFVVLKTNKHRKLTESKYNERVSECNHALQILKHKFDIKTLCDLNLNDLETSKDLFINNDILYKRAHHVISENIRVKEFKEALEKGAINKLGLLLNESHESLKNDYEVTGEHLDIIVEESLKNKAVGARMTGAGFGGCAIALINKHDLKQFIKNVSNEYFKRTHIIPEIFMVSIVDGIKKDSERLDI
jgi:galactokinase